MKTRHVLDMLKFQTAAASLWREGIPYKKYFKFTNMVKPKTFYPRFWCNPRLENHLCYWLTFCDHFFVYIRPSFLFYYMNNYINYCNENDISTKKKLIINLYWYTVYVTCHIKTSSISQNIENELVSDVWRASAHVSNAPKIINISQLFRKSSIKQDLEI